MVTTTKCHAIWWWLVVYISSGITALEEVFDFDEQMTHMFFEGFRHQAEGYARE
jgi:hypothetical protein